MQTIAVIDYGMGNLRSVVNALRVVSDGRDRVLLTSEPEQVLAADRVVFPGQGAAGDCMRAIDQYGLREAILSAARQQPFLGICMGMQVLVDSSEENQGTDCLGLFSGRVRYFGDGHRDQSGVKLKVPHMGWNRVTQTQEHPLWDSIADGSRFYFVHSYYVEVDDAALVAGETDYGFSFTSAIATDNLFALQCHPEKSAAAGLQLLRNFVNWDGQA
ncbi:MAG: imidazole glycerol phosphate synthase subunit HisH [Gammaproteobacteria bacterium]|nr:MAG: imidazole glycerol phosphate synthase subunit HisH [Gammaproteobacteria bacterium]UCH40346.1 MAG: imidazole glycerol phosphate synthase subunit HisH [Gammaproteobacteria bacterium]